ncbi:hypothetical protein [Desulfopila inferna]|uniref:hypothetical protein n=1 Tax=Desulfopila inferna TaxID=468528 RepID=UPI0019655C3D|nr:hypothetical protein [Desulfopila inferna]MBM9604022.1 hypothetical protein [Desulfopila inferna]
MIIRIILVLFVSGASAISYMAGYARVMSGLLIGFGALASVFFGILFVVPQQNRQLWFPIYGDGAAWPFFLLALILAGIAALLFSGRKESAEEETVSSHHFQYFIGGFFAYILSVFLPALLWFPSDEKRLSMDSGTLGMYVFAGTCLYLIGTMAALFLFYKASKGVAPDYPDLMRKIILALFSMLHFDKVPAFVSFLLIYSPETRIIYPSIAALALSAYIPVSFFLLKLSWQSERAE